MAVLLNQHLPSGHLRPGSRPASASAALVEVVRKQPVMARAARRCTPRSLLCTPFLGQGGRPCHYPIQHDGLHRPLVYLFDYAAPVPTSPAHSSSLPPPAA
ncbi:unnamed protein product [Heterosigma akashiwo]